MDITELFRSGSGEEEESPDDDSDDGGDGDGGDDDDGDDIVGAPVEGWHFIDPPGGRRRWQDGRASTLPIQRQPFQNTRIALLPMHTGQSKEQAFNLTLGMLRRRR